MDSEGNNLRKSLFTSCVGDENMPLSPYDEEDEKETAVEVKKRKRPRHLYM